MFRAKRQKGAWGHHDSGYQNDTWIKLFHLKKWQYHPENLEILKVKLVFIRCLEAKAKYIL